MEPRSLLAGVALGFVLRAAASSAEAFCRRRREGKLAASNRKGATAAEEARAQARDDCGAEIARRKADGRAKAAAAARTRTVVEADALAWMAQQDSFPEGSCVVTGIPDIVEASPGSGTMSIERYRAWLQDVAVMIFQRLPQGSRAIFIQTDTKVECGAGAYSEWVDKSFLLQLAAQRMGDVKLLWHKIAAFDAVGSNSSRGGGLTKTRYSHVLCFGRGASCNERHDGPTASVPDVVRRGQTTWARGTGVRCCLAVCRYVKKSGFNLVVDPFCGEGLVLAVAGRCGLDGLGVELSRKRAETARRLDAGPLLAQDALDEGVGGASSSAGV